MQLNNALPAERTADSMKQQHGSERAEGTFDDDREYQTQTDYFACRC